VDSQISNLARQAATGDYAAAKRLIDVLDDQSDEQQELMRIVEVVENIMRMVV
jgi:ferritin